MSTDAPGPSEPAAVPSPVRSRAILPTSPTGWALIAIGLIVFAYGLWRVLDRGAGLIGFGAMAVGAIILPYRLTGIIGGAALIALGIRECVILNMVTLMGGVLAVLGALTIVDKLRRD